MAKSANCHHISNGSWRLRSCLNSILAVLATLAVVLILSATVATIDQLQSVVLFDVRSICIVRSSDVATEPPNISQTKIVPSAITDSTGERSKHSTGDLAKPPPNIPTKDGGIAPSPPAAESSGLKRSSDFGTSRDNAEKSSNVTTEDDGRAPTPATVEAFSVDRAASPTGANSAENSSTIPVAILEGDHAKDQTNDSEGNVEQEEEGTCDLFEGRWVYDESSRPLYSGHGCSYIYREVACDRYGRTDTRYQHWRWQPNGCNLTSFNATNLLKRLEGKRMVFVGDSVNRNQWMSMVCLLESSIPDGHKNLENLGSLITFKAIDYNASIDFYWAPLLVESNCDNPIYHRGLDRTIRPESIEKHARQWEDADILVFYSYLWWKQPKIMFNLTGSSGGQNGTIVEVDNLQAYERALKTWSDWLQFHMDAPKKQIYFVSMAPTHIWGQDWGTSKSNCYGETEPIYKEGQRITEMDIAIMRKAEVAIKTLRDSGVYVQLLNITHLTEYRKDGHPSIYRKYWGNLTEEQIADPSSYSDCIHWCLPGVPDVWNELLYAYMFPQQQKYKTSI